jgi:hypothetical protein
MIYNEERAFWIADRCEAADADVAVTTAKLVALSLPVFLSGRALPLFPRLRNPGRCDLC